ncbi:MAG: 16S rRNA (guanine(966)-N(2))-methyltransferase RsmD [Eubacterium sp.]
MNRGNPAGISPAGNRFHTERNPMRIIAGTARSLPLKSLPGSDTRPTTDRIKETLFNMIQTRVPGSVVLDLFAGSGSLALEAVSRGAEKAVLVENSRKAAAVIQENINFTKFQSRCNLLVMDALTALPTMERRYVFDLVFLDPPYGKELEIQALDYLSRSSAITEETLIIVETSIDTDISVYTRDGIYEITKDKRYKTNQHVFLKRVRN